MIFIQVVTAFTFFGRTRNSLKRSVYWMPFSLKNSSETASETKQQCEYFMREHLKMHVFRSLYFLLTYSESLWVWRTASQNQCWPISSAMLSSKGKQNGQEKRSSSTWSCFDENIQCLCNVSNLEKQFQRISELLTNSFLVVRWALSSLSLLLILH